MTFTNKEKQMIKDFLKEKGIDIRQEDGYDLVLEPNEFYERLMDKYDLAFSYKGGQHIEQLEMRELL